jgi:ferritin
MYATVVKLVNDQIVHEFHAAYTYLAMAAQFEDQNYEGFARWMRLQAKEETAHAMRLLPLRPRIAE